MEYTACYVRIPRIKEQRKEDQWLKLENETDFGVPKPMRYNEIPRIPTSRPTRNSFEMSCSPGDRIVVPKFDTKMASDTVNVTCLMG